MIAVYPGPDVPPLEAARRLAGLPGRFLLHSASDADGVGRWSFAGARPARVLRGRLGDPAEPFAAAAALVDDVADDLPLPRVVGWFGYELGRAVERLPPPRPRATWDLWLGAYDAVWRRDARTGRAEVAGTPAAAAELRDALARPAPDSRPPVLGALGPEAPAERHLSAVARALEYIRAGDIYQANLSRRLRAPLLAPGDAVELYARLPPAPFGGVVEAEGAALISNSPELFLRRAAGGATVETRPIKGTCALGGAAALAADPKELAEHLMIVDLLRNDLGRVADVGSVRVDGYARVVTLPTVHHLVSTVSGAAGAGTAALLRATFPGGSVTGAPKVRAMEIIDELEPAARGVYTGAFGWLGARGALDLAIVIRSALLMPDHLSLAVGGGVVADSTPARELEETEEKALAWRRLLEGGRPD